jgi:hypothetical protein
MTGGARRDWRAVGCAALLGAAIAFPAGIMVGGGREAPSRNAAESRHPVLPGRAAPTARNPFSPNVLGDAYVIEEQRKVLRALESSCRQSKRLCTEAEQARRRIEEAEAGR